ncbi:MAG: LacI family DNA-binding transcriptional regulator [Anaerolineae bacterium]|nr:LacI family DNA-binding transcriptional regulator [Anaerolineae bacterium]
MAVTIKDIAKRAGVSHTTVSRALNGNPVIPESTAAHIRTIAHEMGYLPSAAARGLKTNHSHALGLIVSSIDNPYFGEIIQGIEDAIQDSGYSIFVASSRLDEEREKNIIRALGEHRVDGILIGSVTFNREHTSLLKQYGIPIVVINNQTPRNYRYSIAHDDYHGARMVTSHLLSLGHQRIAYLGDRHSPRVNHNRKQGFLAQIKKVDEGMTTSLVIDMPGSEIENGAEGARLLLRHALPPTAIFCFNDLMAIGALKALKQEGVQVPEDISVAGFDNIAYAAYTSPALTTFDQPKYEIGMAAARMLLQLIEQPEAADTPAIPHKHRIQGQLLVRESTAPCSKRRTL